VSGLRVLCSKASKTSSSGVRGEDSPEDDIFKMKIEFFNLGGDVQLAVSLFVQFVGVCEASDEGAALSGLAIAAEGIWTPPPFLFVRIYHTTNAQLSLRLIANYNIISKPLPVKIEMKRLPRWQLGVVLRCDASAKRFKSTRAPGPGSFFGLTGLNLSTSDMKNDDEMAVKEESSSRRLYVPGPGIFALFSSDSRFGPGMNALRGQAWGGGGAVNAEALGDGGAIGVASSYVPGPGMNDFCCRGGRTW
jgi:hypothetical protein